MTNRTSKGTRPSGRGGKVKTTKSTKKKKPRY